MKKVILFAVALVFCLTAVPALAQDSKGTITMVFKELRNNKGRVGAVIFKGAEGFPKEKDKAVAAARGEIKDKVGTVVFKDLPYGEYAVAIIHDENENGKMDYSALGLPEEGYGFSNNAKGILGPPDYKDAAFKLDKPDLTLTIKPNY